MGDVLVWSSIAIGVHIILGGLMWVAWLTVLPHRDRRSRPVTAIAVFGALGIARGLLMQGAQDLTGIGGGVFVERMGINVLGGIVVLAAVAIVVDDFRVDADIRSRLEGATQTLAMVRDQEERALQAADIDVLAKVQLAVQRALDDSGADPLKSRAVAEQIVRPISHGLVDDERELSLIPQGADRPPQSLRFTDAFAATQAPSPVAVAVLIEMTVLGAVLGRYGPIVALANAVIGGLLVFLGGVVIRRHLRLARSVLMRLLVLGIAFALVGVASSVIVSALVSRLIAPFPIALPSVMAGTAAAAIIVSLSAAVVTGRRQRLDDMAQAVARSAAEVDRLRATIQDRRSRAARFLHGPIQGELVAAALRGDSPETVQAAISARFAEYGVEPPARPSRDQVMEVIDAWSSILDVSADVDESVMKLLERDPLRMELLVDALSEALTNVVRHSAARTVSVVFGWSGARVLLEVTSVGGIEQEPNPGIGLEQMRKRGGEVTLVSHEGNTTLHFAI